jgi:hypothetical protein
MVFGPVSPRSAPGGEDTMRCIAIFTASLVGFFFGQLILASAQVARESRAAPTGSTSQVTRLEVSRDTWVSEGGQEADGNNGTGSLSLRTEGPGRTGSAKVYGPGPGKRLHQGRQQAVNEGFIEFRKSSLLKVTRGEASAEVIRRAIPSIVPEHRGVSVEPTERPGEYP